LAGLHRSRVRALQAIVAGIPCIAAHPKHSSIQHELGEVHRVRKVRRSDRRRLLEVIHSSRSLDTVLSAFVGHHGARKGGAAPPKNLGAYLIALEQHSVVGLGALTAAQRAHFYLRIVKVRNTYMHEAGAVPSTDVDVQSLLSEMHACLTVVSRL